MNCCTNEAPVAPGNPARATHVDQSFPLTRTYFRRALRTIEWVVPVATLALIPKCPGCIAGYVLLISGIGLSLSAATAIRFGLIGFCIAALAYLTFRTLRGVLAVRV
ncbi:MAG: hypothetical protein KF691_08800 [Phycisphaeraceae bacterium]|nr:hypothetical protein [Phycisphaeraceae bacterium]